MTTEMPTFSDVTAAVPSAWDVTMDIIDPTPAIIITGITGTLGQALRNEFAAWWRVIGGSLHGSNEIDVYQVDVREPAEVCAWFDALAMQKVNAYALITCAGIAAVEPIIHQSPGDFQNVMNTNVLGTWLCIREAVRHGVKRIVTVSSILGGAPIAYPDRCAYTTSKAAIVGMTRALAVELAPQGIAVNCVVPGHFSLMASKAKGLLKGALGRSPQGRLVTPEEVAEVIAWLVAEAPAAVNGAVLAVDGAYSLSAYPVTRWWEK